MNTRFRSDAIFVLFFLLLIAQGGSAALSISESDVHFGGTSQEKFTSTGGSIALTMSFTLTATTDYTNLTLTFTPASGFPQGNLQLPVASTINASQSLTLTLNLAIPNDFDAVDDDLAA